MSPQSKYWGTCPPCPIGIDAPGRQSSSYIPCKHKLLTDDRQNTDTLCPFESISFSWRQNTHVEFDEYAMKIDWVCERWRWLADWLTRLGLQTVRCEGCVQRRIAFRRRNGVPRGHVTIPTLLSCLWCYGVPRCSVDIFVGVRRVPDIVTHQSVS